MKKHYSVSIPKPCHEDWNTMTPKQKGRFCDSCAKTVVDFTKMNTPEIQDFIHKNKRNRICGHFKQTQLDSININIPSRILIQQHSFHKLFLLALLITMGSSLFNCTNKSGNKQKIDSIEVIDSVDNKTIDILGGLPNIIIVDSIKQNKACKTAPEKASVTEIMTDGELIIETLGDVEYIETSITGIDSINTIEPPKIIDPIGIVVYEEEEDLVIGYLVVDTPPEFKNTPKTFSKEEKRKYMSKQIAEIVSKSFNTSVCLELKGKQKIHTQFKIDEKGNVVDIKSRAPHPKLEEEAKRVIKLLPQFIPARQRDKAVPVIYSLPIIFQVEE